VFLCTIVCIVHPRRFPLRLAFEVYSQWTAMLSGPGTMSQALIRWWSALPFGAPQFRRHGLAPQLPLRKATLRTHLSTLPSRLCARPLGPASEGEMRSLLPMGAYCRWDSGDGTRSKMGALLPMGFGVKSGNKDSRNLFSTCRQKAVNVGANTSAGDRQLRAYGLRAERWACVAFITIRSRLRKR